jgi:myo-inositol-1(or 4)-monophosphatase
VITDLDGYLAAAMTAVDQARDLIRTRRPGMVTEKADRDLVSDTDLAVERAVRASLRENTPDIPVLGEEEGGPSTADTGWLWTLDPIDGTSNYAHGIPLCAASLALLRDGRPVLGVIDAPFLAERFHAAEGAGAWSGDRRLAASTTAELRDATIAIGDYATGPGAARKN